MRKVNLTDNEIDGINLFTSEMVILPIVEAIYLVAYKTKIFGETSIDIVTVYNNSLAYDYLLTDGDIRRNSTSELDKVYADISEYQELFNNSRLQFLAQNASDFLPFILTVRERIAKRELAGGIIIFDRFDNIKKKQTEARNEFGISSTVKITNIDKIKSIDSSYEKKLNATTK